MTELLSGHRLCLYRGERRLFESLDFALNSGELLTIAGTNGSGKTSLLRGIAGLLEFEDGELHWRGSKLSRNDPAYRADIAWMGHRTGFKSDLSLVENLRFELKLGAATSTTVSDALEAVDLQRHTEISFRSLSAGQQRRASLARLLLSRAHMWLLDEPTSNLDQAGRNLTCRLIAEHLKNGGAVVAATHHALEVPGRSQRIDLS